MVRQSLSILAAVHLRESISVLPRATLTSGLVSTLCPAAWMYDFDIRSRLIPNLRHQALSVITEGTALALPTLVLRLLC